MTSRKVPLWLIRKYFDAQRTDGEWTYRCVLCGEVVEKNMRSRHLLFKHPLIFAKLEKIAEEWREE